MSARYRAPAFTVPGLQTGDLGAAARGPGLGLHLTGDGRLATVTEADSIRQSLLLLMSTRPGERVNRPEYGCHLWRMVFAPNDDTTAGLAMHYVGRAVEQWEHRVVVLGVDAAPSPQDPALLEVRLRYRIRVNQHDDEITVAVPLDGAAS